MDPYQVLGISQTATDEEVKDAYRKLSMKYHPDYHDESMLKDVAEQKMAELNAAYDEIMNMRRNKAAGASGNVYLDARCQIEQGNYTAADNILEQYRNESNAEWNYLKGTVCLARGWLNDAVSYISRAVQLDPANREYQAALQQMKKRQTGQMNGNPYTQANNADPTNCLCNACQCIVCTDCLCNCLGGGC